MNISPARTARSTSFSIDFHDPSETFDPKLYRESGAFAVCARPGLLEAPIHTGRMTHFVRDTDYGCEMRSRFWLGMISHRDPAITLPEAQVRAMRAENLNAEFARRLHQHCVEEMGYLAEILPVALSARHPRRRLLTQKRARRAINKFNLGGTHESSA